MLTLHSGEDFVKDPNLMSLVRRQRSAAGLSQSSLAASLGVSRQAIVAIEAGRQVPSTVLALQLARVLSCSVDDLFQLAGGPVVRARGAGTCCDSARVVIGRVDDDLVAHYLSDPTHAADGVLLEPALAGEHWKIELLSDPSDVDANLLVAGCAPLLGALSTRLGRQFRDSRATWISADSAKALDLLARGLVHVAGVHLADTRDPDAHARAARAIFPGQRTTIINLARWRQGLLVAAGNPLGLVVGPDLVRDDVRHVLREPGSGARRVFDRILAEADIAELPPNGVSAIASGHAEVARLIRCGAADVGVAIEAEALSHGLDFIPLSEERFDLIVLESRLETKVVSRFIDLIDRDPFRAEAARMPGYDLSQAGHASCVAIGGSP